MSAETFKVWITKYALTKGIYQSPVRPASIAGCVWAGATNYDDFCRPKDWHRDEASAKARAEEMRRAKIASLERQIERLKGMEF